MWFVSSAPRPSGIRKSALFTLYKPLACRGDKPYYGVRLRPRNIERKLHPRFTTNQHVRTVFGNTAIGKQLAWRNKDLRLGLRRIKDKEHVRAGGTTSRVEFDFVEAHQSARSIGSRFYALSVDNNQVVNRSLNIFRHHQLTTPLGAARKW